MSPRHQCSILFVCCRAWAIAGSQWDWRLFLPEPVSRGQRSGVATVVGVRHRPTKPGSWAAAARRERRRPARQFQRWRWGMTGYNVTVHIPMDNPRGPHVFRSNFSTRGHSAALAAGATTYPVQGACGGVYGCLAASTEQHRDTCPTWQCLSAVPHVVSYSQRRPLISWYHQHVGHQLETVCSPSQVYERGTVYRQPSAQSPNCSLPSKKNLISFFWLSFWWILTMLSALVIVCTVW